MTKLRSVIQSVIAALSATAVAGSAALAVPAVPVGVESLVHPIAGDCYAIGEQVAAQNGGTLAKASPSTEGGQPVCVVVILVPGKDGQRPRRVQLVVPQN
ncbi:MAG TPA: hypothetical protein VFP43_05050 [Mesorhizobium sp.]|nr:hypothetical protein [Mesorhizobium sp.]